MDFLEDVNYCNYNLYDNVIDKSFCCSDLDASIRVNLEGQHTNLPFYFSRLKLARHVNERKFMDYMRRFQLMHVSFLIGRNL